MNPICEYISPHGHCCRAPATWTLAIFGQWTLNVCDLHKLFKVDQATSIHRIGNRASAPNNAADPQ